MKAKHLLLLACAAVLAGSCSKESPIDSTESILKVQLNVVSDIMSRSTAATADENKVNSFDIFMFDAETGLLEAFERNLPTTTPTAGNLAGELKVGEVTFTLTNTKNKNIVAVANAGSNVTYPDFSRYTSYSSMLNAVAMMNPENRMPSTPFVMSGYANGVNSSTNDITVTMRRRVAKIAVVNRSENDGLVITGLQLKRAVNQAYLFRNDYPALDYTDYEPIAASSSTATLYTYPQPAATNNMTLTVSGTLDGAGFTQTIDVLPVKDCIPQDMNSNTLYTIDITAEDQTITAEITTQLIEEWSDGSNIPGAVTMVKGTAGPLTWALTADSTLTISGKGEMPDYKHFPWLVYRALIKTVIVNNGVSGIGIRAFESCSELINISISNSVTSIRELSFVDCPKLTNVTIPSSVINIETHAFVDNLGLTDIEVAEDNPAYTSEDGVLFNKSKTILIKYPDGKQNIDYIIPNGVTSIGRGAFWSSSELTNITISSSVANIESTAFYDLPKLTSITTLATTPPALTANAFYYTKNNATLYVPAGCVEAYKASAWNDVFETIMEMP